MTPAPAASTRSLMTNVEGPLHYLDMGGPADGPLLVGVHGLGGSHLNWSAVGPLLSSHSRVLALDLVGHGLTPTGSRTADIEGHRRLLSGFLRALGGRPAILIGNSMGGLVAALQAATEPESVAGLILIDPALPAVRIGLVHPRVIVNLLVCAVPGLGEGYLAQRRRRVTAEQSVRRTLDVCCVDASRIPAEVVEAHMELAARQDRAQSEAAYLRSARSLSSVMARPGRTADQLDHLSQPTLLLQGARDLLVPLAATRRLSQAHPSWRFEIAPDIGHTPMLEAPQWTGAIIDDWLAREGVSASVSASGSGSASSSASGSGGGPVPG